MNYFDGLLSLVGVQEKIIRWLTRSEEMKDERWIFAYNRGSERLLNTAAHVLRKSLEDDAGSGADPDAAESLVMLEADRIVEAAEILAGMSEKIMDKRIKFFKFGLMSTPGRASADHLKIGSQSRKMQSSAKTAVSTELIRRANRKRDREKAGDSLANIEDKEKAKAVRKLQAISVRAGEASQLYIAGLGVLDEDEIEEMKDLVLSSGAFSTIKGHVRAWERLEQFAKDHGLVEQLYPPSMELVLKYALHLDKEGCGPSVIPSVRCSISWICRRLVMTTPDLTSSYLKTLEARIFEERGEEIRKAKPYPMDLVSALEVTVVKYAKHETRQALSYVAWLVLIMIYASLRFSDLLHTKPDTLEFKGGSMFGSCWRTKVERKRRGTKFAVPNVSISGAEWLKTGKEVFDEMAPEKRDFMIFDVNPWSDLRDAPMDYARCASVVEKVLIIAWTSWKKQHPGCLEIDLTDFRLHSGRVTMIDAGSHADVADKAQMAQANWMSAEMPMEYTRQNKMIAISMVHDIVKKVKKGWRPGSAEVDDSSEEEEEESSRLLYVKREGSVSKVGSLKYHVEAADDPAVLACERKYKVSRCEPMGAFAPSIDLVCKQCRKLRKDLF